MSGGIVVHYRNLSPYACTLSGFPTVIGLVSPAGPSKWPRTWLAGV